ncbi:MAG: polyketide synthase dehydratase domain-containing protein, partial [Acidobacteria bacterium]|nr:polyketide synthase dehydratase domain-containing protein [Acidobacteriota bacterium]
GSVKSNIGHLIAAAGVAGLAKLLLQLDRKRLVPSPYGDSLNPKIDFAETPFVVQTASEPWRRPRLPSGETVPLRAGISSFGAGGSNAHLILEEAPERPAVEAPGPYLLVLSARDEDRLRARAEDLVAAFATIIHPELSAGISPTIRGRGSVSVSADLGGGGHGRDSLDRLLFHLGEVMGVEPAEIDPDLDWLEWGVDEEILDALAAQLLSGAVGASELQRSQLEQARTPRRAARLLEALPSSEAESPSLATISFTLQAGREAMPQRLALVASDRQEALAKLRSWLAGEAEGVYAGKAKKGRKAPSVEGQRDRTQLEELARAWVEGADVDWRGLYPDETPLRCSLPTYPFAGERYWFPKLDTTEAASGLEDGTSSPRTSVVQPAEGNGAGSAALQPGIPDAHPLLDDGAGSEEGWTFRKRFTPGLFFVSDHVVEGRPILPGVVYLEMVRAALEWMGTADLDLRDVVFRQPLEIREAVEVTLELSAKGEGWAFEVRS